MAGKQRYSDEEIDQILEERRPKKSEGVIAVSGGKCGKELWGWIRILVITAAVSFFVFFCAFRVVNVQGHSMEPTLIDGDRLVISGLFYDPRPGDVVVLSDRNGLHERLVKRIIATGGQTVRFEEGKIYVDEELMEEPYLSVTETDPGPMGTVLEVPEGYVFVMGDNRPYSTDSRFPQVGYIAEKEIIGHVLFRFLPLGRAGQIR